MLIKTSSYRILWLMVLIFVCLGVNISSGAETIKAMWDANTEADLAGYKVYSSRTSGGPYVLLSDVGNKTELVIDISTEVDGKIYYVCTAYDTNGNESGYSNEAVWTVDHTSPAPPSGCRIIKL